MMRLKINKRKVAMEILVFFGCVIAFCALWLVAVLRNSHYSNSIASLQIQEAKLREQIREITPSARKEINWDAVPDEANPTRIVQSAKKQTIEENLDKLNKELITIQDTRHIAESHMSGAWNVNHYLVICFLIIISVAYGLRYSIISIVWAIGVITNKNESKSLSNNSDREIQTS